MAANPIPGIMRTEPFVIPRTPLDKSYLPGVELLTTEDRRDIETELTRLRAEQARRSNTQGSDQ